jgi:hypothetical protein
MKKNWKSIVNEPAAIMSWMIISLCTNGLSTREQVKDVEKFFGGKDTSVSLDSKGKRRIGEGD